MDIPALSMRMAQTRLMTDVGTAILAKSIDQADTTAAALTDMIDAAGMERSVNPGIGGNIDIRV